MVFHKFILLFIGVISIPSLSWAAGTFQLSGKVRSFNLKSFEVSDGHNIYTIEKEPLGPSYDNFLRPLKIGQKIDLQIPFHAVSKTQRQIK